MASLPATESDHDFVEKPSEDFFCPVTFDILREPHLTPCCGNHLSAIAVTKLQGQPCPVCKEPNLNTVPDKYFKRKVNELKLRCPNKSLGCEWVGELGSLDRHLSQNSVEGECQFVTVACPYFCGDGFQRCQLQGHKANSCNNRPFICRYCNHEATYIKVTDDHWPVCEKYPLHCPNECGEDVIERQHLQKHLDENCPLQVIKCEFSYAGCKVECQRRYMQTHVDENMKVHLSKVSCTLKSTIEQQQKQIVALMSATQVALDMQKPLARVFVTPPDIVMTDFEEHKKADNRWFSPPFYSHIGGYKMCLCVIANGFGKGKGTHVTVSFYMMRGENDDHLKWPFRGEITVQLLNQTRDEKHWKETINFNDDAGDNRVIGLERATRSWGRLLFITHTKLNTEDKQYLKNDCLKFRVTNIFIKSI